MSRASSMSPLSNSSISGLAPEFVDGLRHDPDVAGRVDDSLGAERHRVQVQGRDIRLEIGNMLDAAKRRQKVGPRPGDGGIVVARVIAAPGPGGQVQDQRVVLCADQPHDLAIVRQLHRRPPVRMADVNVDDRGARGGGVQTRLRDLLGRDRQIGILIGAGQVAGDGAGQDGFHRLFVSLSSAEASAFSPAAASPTVLPTCYTAGLQADRHLPRQGSAEERHARRPLTLATAKLLTTVRTAHAAI